MKSAKGWTSARTASGRITSEPYLLLQHEPGRDGRAFLFAQLRALALASSYFDCADSTASMCFSAQCANADTV